MAETSEIPGEAKQKLLELSQKFNIALEDLEKQYWEIYNDPFVQTDPQFKTDKDRHLYAVRVLWVRTAAQPPTKEYVVIPFGYTEPRTTKSSGLMMSRIYVLVRTDKGIERRVIVCRGAQADLCHDVQLFHAYRVKLSEFGNLLLATANTRFSDPKPIPVEPVKLLTRDVGASLIAIADTPYNVSRKDQSGRYVDEFDLKLVRGIVLRYNRGKRPDGSEWAFYVISDDSVTEEGVTPDGKVIPTQFTVWVPASMLKYDVESDLMFLGTIQLNDTEPVMNAICVIPIVARPIQV